MYLGVSSAVRKGGLNSSHLVSEEEDDDMVVGVCVEQERERDERGDEEQQLYSVDSISRMNVGELSQTCVSFEEKTKQQVFAYDAPKILRFPGLSVDME